MAVRFRGSLLVALKFMRGAKGQRHRCVRDPLRVLVLAIAFCRVRLGRNAAMQTDEPFKSSQI